jgi:hypothetical protein
LNIYLRVKIAKQPEKVVVQTPQRRVDACSKKNSIRKILSSFELRNVERAALGYIEWLDNQDCIGIDPTFDCARKRATI